MKIESQMAGEERSGVFQYLSGHGRRGDDGALVRAEPRLVGADYIHPMPGGAKIVGELLYSALRDGYNEYKLRQLREQNVAGNSSRHQTRPPRSGNKTADTGVTKKAAEGGDRK